MFLDIDLNPRPYFEIGSHELVRGFAKPRIIAYPVHNGRNSSEIMTGRRKDARGSNKPQQNN
jgi:hypothetical protein